MKKFTILACVAMFAGTLFAQEDALKQAERGLKVEVPDHAKIASLLEGAMTDPATANDPKTWYLAGKNGFQTFQTGYEQFQVGGSPDVVAMSNAIVRGYDYYLKALAMDTIIDEKGKVKTKYSKDIVKAIAGSSQNFNDAGVWLYEANDLKGAYRAWEIMMGLPHLPQLGKLAPAEQPDSVQATTYYNMGIFAYQADMKPEALRSFYDAAKKGFGETAYDNALAMATELDDMAAIEAIANEAFAKYGKQNYIGSLVNIYIKKGQYEQALNMINTALEQSPDNAILYSVKGILVENRTNDESISPEEKDKYNEEAIGYYKKASELDPNNAEAHFHYGRMLYNKGQNIGNSDAAAAMSTPDYNKLKAEVIEPLFRQAAEELEKAIAIDKNANRQAFSILKNLYYNLNDEENQKRIEELEMED